MSETTILSQMRAGLVANLRQIDGLHVYDSPVGSPVTPCAYVLRGRTDWGLTFKRGTDMWTFRVQVLVAKTTDKTAQAKLDLYVDPTSTRSILKAIQTKDGPAGQVTLGGVAFSCRVTETDEDAVFEQALDSVLGQYLGCEFTVEVYASGR